MTFQDRYHPGVKKDLKKLDRSITTAIRSEHIPKILSAPFSPPMLRGNLAGLYSYHFTQNSVDYRISYMVDEAAQTVVILMIGTRENFYSVLKKRLRS